MVISREDKQIKCPSWRVNFSAGTREATRQEVQAIAEKARVSRAGVTVASAGNAYITLTWPGEGVKHDGAHGWVARKLLNP
jgi:hypothetical protein